MLYVSAAPLLGVESAGAQEHTYVEIVEALRVNGSTAQADIEELWRRVAFSILITNVDDHLRNPGFLHVERSLWRLAPAFDLNPFPDRARELKTWISPDTDPKATIEALMSVIACFRVPLSRAKAFLSQGETTVDDWRNAGRTLGMSDRELSPLADAFEHAERAAAQKVSAR